MSRFMIKAMIIGFVVALLCGFATSIFTANPDGTPRLFVGSATSFIVCMTIAMTCIVIETRKKRSMK